MPKIKFWIIVLLLAFANSVFAHQIDMVDHYLSDIKKAISIDNYNEHSINSIMQRFDSLDFATINTSFNQIILESIKQGDELVACCASIMATTFFINHQDYNKALYFINLAFDYNHERTRVLYLNFLKGLICFNLNKFDLAYQFISQVIASNDGAMLNVLKCESYRYTADYYNHYYNVAKSLEYLQLYTNMYDTVVCKQTAPEYFVLPTFMHDKYINRKVVLQQSSPAPISNNNLMICLSVGGILLLTSIAFATTKYFAFGKIAKNVTIHKDDSTVNTFLSGSSSVTALAVMANTSDVFIVLDRSGNIDYVNPAFEKLYGQTMRQYILQHGQNLFASDNEIRRNALEMCRNTKFQQTCYFAVNTDSKQIMVLCKVAPIISDNEITHFVITESDVSHIQVLSNFDNINNQLNSNLRDAQSIQQSLLPCKDIISHYYESFVIYKPKDIVSGDFYLFKHFDSINETIVAVGDCAGHGVSGAMMSVFMMRLLDEILSAQHYNSPATILSLLEQKVAKTLNANSKSFVGGMDISLASIKRNNDKANVTIAGAKSYFVYYNCNSKTAQLIKGTRKSIGSCDDDIVQRKFENHELSLTIGDRLFLSSDGFIDQNNSERKCFGSQRFTEIIQQSSEMSINNQQLFIEETLLQWQNNQPQRDDICLLALQI